MDRLSQTLYVGNLPGDICELEVKDLFHKYGPIVYTELKFPPRQPAYAFVEFEDYRDADDAIHGRDGYNLDGHQLRVEPARKGRGPSSYREGGPRGGSRHSGHKGRSSSIIYVGNLPGDVRVREVEDFFYKYGPIVEVDLKTPPRPPVYAFVEFEDPRDADDAIRGRDGYNFDGHPLRVELAHGGRGSSSYDSYRSYSSGNNHGGLSRHSDYRVLVTGLPFSASWQDLKDHMRRAGDVCFSEVYRDCDGMRGIVDYSNYDDMKYAVRKLDDSLFNNRSSRAYIRVEEYDSRHSYSSSPSRSFYLRSRSLSHSSGYSDRSRSLSRSKTPPCTASRHRSRSRTPAASKRSD